MEVTSELRVYPRHIRSANLCMRGSRAFFAKHKLNWSEFLQDGIPVAKLQQIGDPIALRAADEAVKESFLGRQ